MQQNQKLQKRPISNLGHLGEDYAVKLLISKGYKILDRNFRSRFGELDIIAQEGVSLVFVEVKTRLNSKYGFPEESVTESKLWKIKRTGEYFSLMHPELPKKLRIDVVALQVSGGKVVSSKIIKVY